jgi:hypothetical protein
LCKLRCHVDGQHFETPQGQHFFRFVWGRFKSLKWLSLKVSHFDHDHVASLQTVAPAMSSLNLSVDIAHFTTRCVHVCVRAQSFTIRAPL